MEKSQIPQGLLSSFKDVFTNIHINVERISDMFVAATLCLIGFALARLVSNTFIRTLGAKFNAHQRMVWRRGFSTRFSCFLLWQVYGKQALKSVSFWVRQGF
jgi:hypothetical protein